MPLNLDFSNVETKTFENVSEGEHLFIISDAEVKPSKAGDSENLVIKAEVTGGDDDGRTLLQFFSLKETALWNLKLFLEAVTGSEIEGSINFDEAELVGQTFIGTVKHTEDGKYANLIAYEPNS